MRSVVPARTAAFLLFAVLLAFAAPSSAQDFSDFTLTTNGGDGGVTEVSPAAGYDLAFEIRGNDAGGANVHTRFETTASADVEVEYLWSYETTDGPDFDPAGFMFAGSDDTLTDPSGMNTQSGSSSFDVTVGQSYGWYVNSTDGCCGAGYLTVSVRFVVADTEPPVFEDVPANITTSTDAGEDTATVTWTSPTATDNVDGAVTPVRTDGPESGSAFPLGDTTITYTATDAAGNAATASFTVTVSDDEAPVFADVPANITTSTDAGEDTATVTWTSPTATDNVDGAVTPVRTDGPESGSAFPLGDTTITYTATDAAGNAATASFTVTVTDDEAPVLADVPADITTSTDPGGDTAVITWTSPTATDNVDGAVTPVRTDGPESGSAFPLGDTTITYTATDAAGNAATASFTVTVSDDEAPVFADVPANITTSTDAGEDTATVTWTSPTATDNVDGAVTPVRTDGPESGSAFPLGDTTITYTATDAAGNAATASFTVTVTQDLTTFPEFDGVPDDIVADTEPGEDTAVVTWTSPTATDANDGEITPVRTEGPAPGSAFPLGVTTITYTATNAAGNAATASFTVTVGDTEPPVLDGVPADIATETDPGLETAEVSWTPPTATDNVDGDITPVQTEGLAPGAAFPVGETTVTYTATDTAGNMATASFTVTVGDTEPPVLDGVPADIATETDPGLETAEVSWTPPTATDNVDGDITPVQTEGLAPGAAFPVGETTITYTATDTAGNMATASFTVTVTLRQYDPEQTTIDVATTTIMANGTDTTQVVVNLRDASGNLLGRGGMNVVLRTTLGTMGPVIDHGDGRYSAMLSAGTISGTATITGAVDGMAIPGSAIVTFEPDQAFIAEVFNEVTGAFLQRRIDRILASEPRLHRLDRRREVQPGTYFSLAVDGQGSDIAGRMFLSGEFGMRPTGGLDVAGVDEGIASRNLSFSLQSVSHDRRWHLWAQGQYSRYVDATGTLGERQGEFGIMHMGGDYLLNERLAVGIMAHFDHARERIHEYSTVSGQGWMIGPYLSSELVDGVFLTARAAWGESRNRAAIDVYEDGNIWRGNFRGQRALARVALSGVHERAGFTFRPELDLAWMEERQRAYSVTDGNAIVDVDGVRASITRLSLSGETEWPVALIGHPARAFVLPVLAWDVGGTGQSRGHPDLQGSLELGLRTSEHAAWRGEAAIRFDGIGTRSFRGWSVRLGADMRF
ncbi:MAG: HYR domain-containing protein [Pararhodobacter sp.]|nr:HYR domain-containing protein [Pararhodobacter sp.]